MQKHLHFQNAKVTPWFNSTSNYSSNDLKVFCMTLSVSQSLWRILACLSLQHCFISLRFLGICLCTALIRSTHSISNGLRSVMWLGCCSAFLSFCCRFAGILGIITLLHDPILVMQQDRHPKQMTSHFDSRIRWCTEEFLVKSLIARSCDCVTRIEVVLPCSFLREEVFSLQLFQTSHTCVVLF